MATPRLRLGQLLVDAQMLTQEALDEVLALQRTDGRRLGTLLVERGLLNEMQLTQILSHQLAVPWISLLHIAFSRQLLDLVPHNLAERYGLIPIYVRHVRYQGDTLYVAMEDPTIEEALKECAAYAGLPVRAMIAPPTDIREAIRVYYGEATRSDPPSGATEPASSHAPADFRVPRSGLRRAGDVALASSVPGAGSPAPGQAAGELPPAGLSGAEETAPVVDAQELDDAELAALVEEELAGESGLQGWGGEEEVQRQTLESMPSEDLIAASRSDEHLLDIPYEAEPFTDPMPPEFDEPPEEPEPGDGETLVSGEDVAPASTAEDEQAPERLSAPAAALINAVLGAGHAGPELAAAAEPPAAPGAEPPSEREVLHLPKPRRRTRRLVTLTLLDGTTITLPARTARKAGVEPAAPADDSALTARDLVAALRAAAQGADATEVLGDNVRWEKMFAALLSLLLKKHLIADWEFVDELKKI